MSAENTIIAKLRAWNARFRLFFQSFFSSIICEFTISFTYCILILKQTHEVKLAHYI